MGAMEGSGLKLLVALGGFTIEMRQVNLHAVYRNLSTKRVNVKVVIEGPWVRRSTARLRLRLRARIAVRGLRLEVRGKGISN